MLQTDVAQNKKFVLQVRQIMTQLADILYNTLGGDAVVYQVCSMRGYYDNRMVELLKSKHIFQMPSLSDIQILAKANNLNLTPDLLRYMGLINHQGSYFLEGRYCTPARNYSGDVIAYICWYPDDRKYITTSTIGFTNTASFFNMESYSKAFQYSDGVSRAFVVEGIYDSLSIESLGYCAFGNEGLALSPIKKEMLSRFDKVYFIPDNDKPGNKSNKYLTKYSTHHWDIPNGYLIQLCSSNIKDMDDYIKKYAPIDLDSWMTNNALLRVNI